MKLKLWLASLTPLALFVACTTSNTNTESTESIKEKNIQTPKNTQNKKAKAVARKSLPIKADQAIALESIINDLTNTSNTEGSISSPEEFFKVINGAIQTNSRELPLQAAVNRATAQKLRITCYQEGNDTVVASSDPTLLGKPVSNFKTNEGQSVRDRAIEEIRTHGKDDKATFTYVEAGGPVVDGKAMGQGRAVAAAGRKAFKGFNSEKKFLCTVAADIEAQ